MTSSELNLKLTTSFPEIQDVYLEETSWQDGDETGSHVVYADVFVPFIKGQIQESNQPLLLRTFDYIEALLGLDDAYANEVIALSVLESLLFDEEVDNKLLIQVSKEKTLLAIQEILQNLEA